MFENRQYNRPSKIEYEGVLEKHRNKPPTADDKFLSWCVKESKKYESYYDMGEQLGLDGRAFKKLCNRNDIELTFNPKAKTTPKPYQNKDWLYNQKITLGKSNKEIADEFGWTKRVIEKWVQFFGFGLRDFKKQKTLSPLQLSLIKGSILGDGHIADNNSFIVSHAEDQKEYLFWKYEVLKDVCSSPPTYYQGQKKYFSGSKAYDCKPWYRFNTRLLNCLKSIKSTPKIEIISDLDDLGIAIWFLDDGNREECNWRLCFAALGDKEKEKTIEILGQRRISSHLCKDTRYLFVNAEGSRKLDELILNNIPNELDIVKAKIFDKRR